MRVKNADEREAGSAGDQGFVRWACLLPPHSSRHIKRLVHDYAQQGQVEAKAAAAN